MKIENFEMLKDRLPERIIEKSVKGMLPKGALGREIFRKLYVYNTDQHPHQAQKPEIVNL
jgi:large subunit ribosomal protein L13